MKRNLKSEGSLCGRHLRFGCLTLSVPAWLSFLIVILIVLLFFLTFNSFLYEFIYFNWRLITLQYCIGFAIH